MIVWACGKAVAIWYENPRPPLAGVMRIEGALPMVTFTWTKRGVPPPWGVSTILPIYWPEVCPVGLALTVRVAAVPAVTVWLGGFTVSHESPVACAV